MRRQNSGAMRCEKDTTYPPTDATRCGDGAAPARWRGHSERMFNINIEVCLIALADSAALAGGLRRADENRAQMRRDNGLPFLISRRQ
jgi:hypothetical protein